MSNSYSIAKLSRLFKVSNSGNQVTVDESGNPSVQVITTPGIKNDILNGQFRVAQTGTSFVSPVDSSYDLDGWIFQYIAAGSTATIAQSVGSYTGKLCRTVTVTAALASPAAADYVIQATHIEGYECVKYIDNTFTVGFNVKSSVPGIHCLAIYNGSTYFIKEYTINLMDTWEYKSITVTGCTSQVSSSTNGIGLTLFFINAMGSDKNSGVDNTWNAFPNMCTANQVNDFANIGNVFALEDVTLNPGTVVAVDDATFEKDLRRCKRYARQYTLHSIGQAITSGFTSSSNLEFQMRAAPTLAGGSTFAGTSGVNGTPAVIYSTADGTGIYNPDDNWTVSNNVRFTGLLEARL